MSQHDSNEIRSAAEILVNNARRSGAGGSGMYNMPPPYDMSRTHSINLFTEEFLGGYMQDGRMSVVRRFFCLFVTFDLIFVSLLWLICIMINGDNIFQAFQKQILHYTIYTSLFDVVGAAICRFLILIFFYAFLYINHWSIITLTTSGSCLFLISKVFVFDWVDSKQQVFEVLLIISSFILAWGEAWFLDCRVIPQERHARHYMRALSTTTHDRTPLMAPFLASQNERPPPESVANFYSPLDTERHSEDEDEQDEEYNQMGLDCLRKAYELFEATDWKMEKVTSKGDTIYSTQRDKIGKVYKLTGRIKYNAKELMEELFYRIEDVPKWNPTLLESKIVRKVNSYTDITYQASVGGGGGIVKSRDFVNLRSFRLFRNGQMCDNVATNASSEDDDTTLNQSYEGSVTTLSDADSSPLGASVGSVRSCETMTVKGQSSKSFETLSKSLGAKGFAETAPVFNADEPPPLDEEEFEDAKDQMKDDKKTNDGATQTIAQPKDKVWISAAISIEYKQVPPTTKYTRGENIVSGFALREIIGKKDACIFEWVLCLDLKGYIPRYVLDAALTSFMSDYMTYLRKYVNEMRRMRKRVPRN